MPANGRNNRRTARRIIMIVVPIWAVVMTFVAFFALLYSMAATTAVEKFVHIQNETSNRKYDIDVDLPNPITGTFGWIFDHLSLPWALLVLVLGFFAIRGVLRRRKNRHTTPATPAAATSGH